MLALRREGFPGDIRHPSGLTAAQLSRLRLRERELANRLYQPLGDMLAEFTAFDISWQLPDSLLLKSDKMSMAASIELRCPFLDVEVAKVASRIASNLKMTADGTIGKVPLRRCLDRRFPEPITRPKRGFPIPLAQWFAGPLRARLEESVFHPQAAWRAFLDSSLIERAWSDFFTHAPHWAPSFYALWLYESWTNGVRSIRVVE